MKYYINYILKSQQIYLRALSHLCVNIYGESTVLILIAYKKVCQLCTPSITCLSVTHNFNQLVSHHVKESLPIYYSLYYIYTKNSSISDYVQGGLPMYSLYYMLNINSTHFYELLHYIPYKKFLYFRSRTGRSAYVLISHHVEVYQTSTRCLKCIIVKVNLFRITQRQVNLYTVSNMYG